MDIKIHSIVDVITNSSSTVFVWPKTTALSTAREIVQDMMTALGVAGQPEDYFDISFEVDPAWLNDRISDAAWQKEKDPAAYEQEVARLKKLTVNCPEVKRGGRLTMEGWSVPPIILRLSPKNCDSLNISSKMLDLFDAGEVEN